MLSKKNRLNREDFWLVKKTGQKIFHNSFLVFYKPSPYLKASVVITKKIAKRAVRRNFLRRTIYSHLSKQNPKLNQSMIIYLQKNEIDLPGLDQVISKLS